MEAVLPAGVSDLLEPIDRFDVRGHRQWLELCQNFLAWERRTMVLADEAAPAKHRAEHRKALVYLLKLTEALAGIDPADKDLDALQWRLRESWGMFCNRPSEDEASRIKGIMAGAFPA